MESGAGAGTQDVTELDAWQKCGALAAVGMTIDEVLLSILSTRAPVPYLLKPCQGFCMSMERLLLNP